MNKFYKMYGSGTADATTLLRELSEKKIYFGHQSVGFNILDGIKDWEKETGVTLEMVESKDFSSVTSVPLVHFRVGSNGDPKSKIDEFVRLVEQIPADESPIAFFKLCYVDITGNTDVDQVFDYYREKMFSLKESYPRITFVACTVPLMGIRRGWKALVKKMIGRPSTYHLSNVARDEFNTRLKDELSGAFPVFDLAAIESTAPDGTAVTFSQEGKDYPYMPGYYTFDLGHLTGFGSKTVSYNLLAFLAEEVK